MAIPDNALIEVSLRMQWLAQSVFNVFQYQVSGVVVPPTAPEVGEAWWNHVKSAYRALAVTGTSATFETVTVRTLNDPSGDLGEFAVPSGERQGTRAAGALGDFMPSYVGCGVRLTVATRATRPGQKRLPFLTQGDVLNQALEAAWLTLATSWANVIDTNMVLGAPAAAVELIPIVVRKDSSGAVIAQQDVVGHLVNTNATTQVSRKIGRGI